MLGVCMLYLKNRDEAEDAMMEGFMKVYKFLPNFNFEGSFQGWIRKIMVHTAIDIYRQKKLVTIDLNDSMNPGFDDNIIESINAQEILKLMNEMPDGYRFILNMYEIEGYSHKEISEMLGISESTSKSQLSRGKIFLRNLIEKTYYTPTKNQS